MKKGPVPRSPPTDKGSDERETGDDRPVTPLRQATPRRKRPAKQAGKRRSRTNSTDGTPLALVVTDAPRGLVLTGDVAALDTLDVRELARRAKP
jgi:hypothetical protein